MSFCANCVEEKPVTRHGRYLLCDDCAGRPLHGPEERVQSSAEKRGSSYGGAGYRPNQDEALSWHRE